MNMRRDFDECKAVFKGKWQGQSPRGPHVTEIDSTDFIDTFASLKSRSVNLYNE
jgi:hypothetical protein